MKQKGHLIYNRSLSLQKLYNVYYNEVNCGMMRIMVISGSIIKMGVHFSLQERIAEF